MSALGGDAHAAALHAFGEAHRDAAGIVVVSAHWQKAMPINVTSWESAPLIYDFGGFPEELNRIKYPAQGDAALAARIDLQLHAAGLPADPGPRPRARPWRVGSATACVARCARFPWCRCRCRP